MRPLCQRLSKHSCFNMKCQTHCSWFHRCRHNNHAIHCISLTSGHMRHSHTGTDVNYKLHIFMEFIFKLIYLLYFYIHICRKRITGGRNKAEFRVLTFTVTVRNVKQFSFKTQLSVEKFGRFTDIYQ